MIKLAKKNIYKLKPYEPGKPIKELKRQLGMREGSIVKLASNENPLGPSPKAVKAMRSCLGQVHRYPDGSCFYLRRKLARFLRLSPDNLVFGNGSDELIDIIVKAFMEKTDEAIITDPAFLEYKIIVKTAGARIKEVPFSCISGESSGFSYDADNILKAITGRTKIIFLGNPDNPTGAYLSKAKLKTFLAECPKNIIIVFDEAYREFVDKKDYSDPCSFIKKNNIIVLRTFSKAYGLAGLRIGYAITDAQIAGCLERVRQPFNVNLLAQEAAFAALSDSAHLSRTKKVISQGRGYLIKNLRSLGLKVIEGSANFMLFSYKGFSGTRLFQSMLPFGVIIRDMKAYGLYDWARLNVGNMAENRKFISVLRKIMADNKSGRTK